MWKINKTLNKKSKKNKKYLAKFWLGTELLKMVKKIFFFFLESPIFRNIYSQNLVPLNYPFPFFIKRYNMM